MRPSEEFKELVRKRVEELSGSDPGYLNIIDVFPGSNPQSEARMIEEVAKSVSEVFSSNPLIVFSSDPPECKKPQIDVRELVKKLMS